MALLDPIQLAGRTARNRLLFGPIVTNLGTEERTFSPRHLAFYRRRAAGGCGTIVIEEASVHPLDWPYERSPLAQRCGESWSQVGRAVQAEGALVLAALGHSGGQGSSAYSQRELWAPSRVPEVASREVPKHMEVEDITAVVDGFAAAARIARQAGLDGVEVNAGQHSLLRQFLSGLTNHRGDEWGADRSRLLRDVLLSVRSALEPEMVLGLRLSCDELAPWAGITPDAGAALAAELSPLIDMLVVVRGSIFSTHATRPDFHDDTGFNLELCRAVRTAVDGQVPVALQGSVVDTTQAQRALDEGVCDLVEMTRAQLADAELASKVAAGTSARPCILCNQRCQVRDNRNPIISCVADPSTGYETVDHTVDIETTAAQPRKVLVVGAGPAGLEAARVAALRGHQVVVAERSDRVGGAAALAGPGRPLIEWLAAQCHRLGVVIETSTEIVDAGNHSSRPDVVVLCTGSRPGEPTYRVARGQRVLDPLDPSVLEANLAAPVLVWDPVGGPIGVALAERLGAQTVLVTPDLVAGNSLSLTGDLAPANTRLSQRSVTVERRAVLRSVRKGKVDIEDRFTGATRTVSAVSVIDAGFRLPNDALHDATGRRHKCAGDCVAPRTIYEAILEGRRVALAI